MHWARDMRKQLSRDSFCISWVFCMAGQFGCVNGTLVPTFKPAVVHADLQLLNLHFLSDGVVSVQLLP